MTGSEKGKGMYDEKDRYPMDANLFAVYLSKFPRSVWKYQPLGVLYTSHLEALIILFTYIPNVATLPSLPSRNSFSLYPPLFL